MISTQPAVSVISAFFPQHLNTSNFSTPLKLEGFDGFGIGDGVGESSNALPEPSIVGDKVKMRVINNGSRHTEILSPRI